MCGVKHLSIFNDGVAQCRDKFAVLFFFRRFLIFVYGHMIKARIFGYSVGFGAKTIIDVVSFVGSPEINIL